MEDSWTAPGVISWPGFRGERILSQQANRNKEHAIKDLCCKTIDIRLCDTRWRNSKYRCYKQMLLAVETARARKEGSRQSWSQVVGVCVDEIDELKVKKQRLQKDVDSLFKSANDLGDKAEKSHSVTCITKSNSLRCSAKDSFRDSRTRTVAWR